MDYKLVSFIMMVTIFPLYVTLIWIFLGIQKSISASYNVLPESLKFLFTLFCWGFAIPTIIASVEVTPWMFFAGAGIAFVGAAPKILDKDEYNVHMVAAISGMVFSQVAICVGYHMVWLNITSVVLCAIIPFIFKKTFFWWMELVLFTAACIAVGKDVL